MEDRKSKKVGIIGAGIIGLSTAICLQDADPCLDITVIAEKFSPDITSDGAAGFWKPSFMRNTPMKNQRRWGKRTIEYLRELLKTENAAHLQMSYISGYMLSDKEIKELAFKDMLIRAERLSDKELEQFPEDIVDGFFVTSVILPGTPYMQWVTKQFQQNGGNVVQRKVKSFDELVGKFDVVVNCTGLGSYELCNDKALTPMRGQVLKVRAPWLKHFYTVRREEERKKGRACHIFPRTTDVVVGGTTQSGNWSTDENISETEYILKKAVEFEPTLKNAVIIKTWVGLRPTRTSVRLEREVVKVKSSNGSGTTLQVVHNYGHGGGGLSLFWGCAEDARDLVMLSLLQSNL